MSLNLMPRVLDYLRANPEQKFTARELASWFFATYPDECRQKQLRSKAKVNPLLSDDDMVGQIAAEIGANGPKKVDSLTGYKMTEGRPRRFYYTLKTDEDEVAEAEESQPLKLDAPVNTSRKEHDLYPLLSDYLVTLSVHSKRIDEKRSSNTRGPHGNRWLHPDLVGLEVLSQDWAREVKECAKLHFSRQVKLWSFEVKPLINGSNVREAYFQAVSNSTWANLAYLVAGEIEGVETMRELRLLAGLHGVGFIRLDAEDPHESEILIPARERPEVDWNTANRLLKENKDFDGYVQLIRQFHQTGDIRPQDWDAQQN